MNKQELIESLRNEYIRGLITEDYYKGKNRCINIALGLVNQLDEPEQVVCSENERTTQLVEIPQFVADWIEKCKDGDHNLFGVFDYAEGEVEDWIFYEGIKNKKINLVARAWLDGYTISPPKTLQVIVKNYDSTVYKTELPEDEAMKLIEGWKEDVK